MGSKNESLLLLKPSSAHHTSMPTYLQDDTLENDNNNNNNDGDNTQDNYNNSSSNVNANNMTAPENQIVRNVTFNSNSEITPNISSSPIGIH